MDLDTRTALAGLNRAFYEKFAGDFARTRQSWPPGFKSILPYLEPAFNLLDLGCGNARLLLFLAEQGWRGHYLGMDSSAGLLAIAGQNAQALAAGPQADFVLADLLDPGWPGAVGGFRPDAIASLAVLHHIPGAAQRRQFLADAASLLAPGGSPDGLLVLSTWQFLSSARLQGHILPWSLAGLSDADVEPDDYLLSWGQGAAGQRYCAYIGEDSLRALAAEAGLHTVATFYADGHEGNLNLYVIFRRQT